MGELSKTEIDDKMMDLDDEQLQDLYTWIDEIPLSRQKRNLTRDFSDGVMVAESIYHFVPKFVEIHNYTPANSTQQKLSNWGTLNRKVFPKLSFNVQESIIRKIATCKPGVVECVLWQLRQKIDLYRQKDNAKISPDGYYGGQEVGTGTDKTEKQHSHVTVSKTTRRVHIANAAKVSTNVGTKPAGRVRSQVHLNELSTEARLLLEEKEQNLLASQETVQILQAKVRRLEQLLHLKDIRIEEQAKRIEQLERKY